MALKVQQPTQPGPPSGGAPRSYNNALIAAAVAAVLVIGGLAIYAFTRNDSGDTTVASSTGDDTSTSSTGSTTTASTSSVASTTTSSTGSSTESSTTSTSASEQSSSTSTIVSTPGSPRPDVVWPSSDQATGFPTAVEAARSFAVDLAGFNDPVVGQFSDEMDGMVEIQPNEGGTTTIVLVRMDANDSSWWVVGAESPDIHLDSPAARDTVSGALHLTGSARAFEGQVTVELYVDGQSQPVLTDFVTGRGDGILGDFDKTIDLPPDVTGHGFLLLTSPSGKDGSAVTVAAIPLTIE